MHKFPYNTEERNSKDVGVTLAFVRNKTFRKRYKSNMEVYNFKEAQLQYCKVILVVYLNKM